MKISGNFFVEKKWILDNLVWSCAKIINKKLHWWK
jgi:hypothetical protein